MAEDNTIKLVDDFVNYIRNKYKEHFITKYDSMFGPVEGPEAGFNMFVKEDGTVLADRLYLKAESQKKGIGTEIMQEMFNWSNKNNQPFEFVLMAGYDDLSSPSKIVQTQKAFQEKLKDVPGLEAFPSEQGMLDTNITTYKYTPQLNTPTNVVDDVTPASVVDEAVEYVDNLNIDNAIKKEVKDKIVKVTGQASGAIPIPGVGQAIDLWETAVLVVGAAALAAGEIDEFPKVIYNYGLDLYESILSGYNIPFQPAKRKEYNPNLERISAGLTWIDRLQPTSYVINPVIEEFQETEATTPTMEIPGFGTVPASEYYQPPVQSTPERDNINTIMTNLMTNISNAQGAYPRTRREIELFGRNPIQVVPQDTADKPEKVEYDSKEKQNLHDIYAELYKNLSNASARIQ